jgi:ribosomal protein S18 acetylase RimI-like enzyme
LFFVEELFRSMKLFIFLGIFCCFSCGLFAGEFQKVSKSDEGFAFVEQYFRSVIEPLYGDQSKALEKIGAGKDRTCELLFDEQHDPEGMLVYKNAPTEEFACLGAQNALEIKTLFVINAGKNSGRGVGSQLLEKVVSVAKELHCSNLVVTVSEEKQESLAFFFKKGFFVTHTMQDKFKKGMEEYVLVRFV